MFSVVNTRKITDFLMEEVIKPATLSSALLLPTSNKTMQYRTSKDRGVVLVSCSLDTRTTTKDIQ